MDVFRRIGLWLGSLLLAVGIFSLLLGRGGAAGPIFQVTMIFALPVWCLCLPFVISFKDAEGRRIWTILVSGILVGPVAMGVWGMILQLRGDSPETVWGGDPLIGVGGLAAMAYALLVGTLTTSFYVTGLRVFRREKRP